MTSTELKRSLTNPLADEQTTNFPFAVYLIVNGVQPFRIVSEVSGRNSYVFAGADIEAHKPGFRRIVRILDTPTDPSSAKEPTHVSANR